MGVSVKESLILADCGGSNGCWCRAWKHELKRLSNRDGIGVTVSHFPPGTSKWIQSSTGYSV
ncbi:MAG: hypothetical protein DRR42_11700 [Gammaproteobacteria bacterium]|nr:MAG: hypothetical protein DRR42_11700 [Gammaproteobacteria bacterium]